jgi:hypothetical protein
MTAAVVPLRTPDRLGRKGHLSVVRPDVLGELGPRWTRIDRIPFGATVEIDHVLLSTAGVFVAQTEAGPDLARAISETRWRARKIGFLLDRVGRPKVTPVLIVSRPAEVAIPGSYGMVDGVLVCRGADVACWRASLDELPPTLGDECIGEMVDILLDHIFRTDAINSVPAPNHVTPRF